MDYPLLTSFEGRLELIEKYDPNYAYEIIEFFGNNPEFQQYGKMIPILRNPVGYGLYPFEEKKEHHARNFLEFLLYYICEAGVRAEYGAEQWDKIYPFLRRTNYNLIDMIENVEGVQPGKKETYQQLHTFLIENNIRPTELSINHIDTLVENVKGIGAGAKAFLEQIFAEDHGRNSVEYTDIGFIKGFCKIYGYDYKTQKPTKKQICDQISKWGECKGIGSKMCRQVYQSGA